MRRTPPSATRIEDSARYNWVEMIRPTTGAASTHAQEAVVSEIGRVATSNSSMTLRAAASHDRGRESRTGDVAVAESEEKSPTSSDEPPARKNVHSTKAYTAIAN